MLQTVLSVAAIAISIGTAGLSFLQWYLEGRRVTVNAYSGIVVGPPVGSRSCLILSVTNHGRIPATVKQWGFDNPREVYAATPSAAVWSHGPQLPHTLEAGASQVWMLDYQEHKAILEKSHPGSRYRLRGFVVLATDKRKTCRSYIQVGTGTSIPVNPIKRWLAKLRRDISIAVVIAGRVGSDHFTMCVQRPSQGLYLTRFTIDVVLDSQESRPSQLLSHSEQTYRFWFRRSICINILDQLLDIPGAWYRIRWYARRRPHEQRHRIPTRKDLAELQNAATPRLPSEERTPSAPRPSRVPQGRLVLGRTTSTGARSMGAGEAESWSGPLLGRQDLLAGHRRHYLQTEFPVGDATVLDPGDDAGAWRLPGWRSPPHVSAVAGRPPNQGDASRFEAVYTKGNCAGKVGAMAEEVRLDARDAFHIATTLGCLANLIYPDDELVPAIYGRHALTEAQRRLLTDPPAHAITGHPEQMANRLRDHVANILGQLGEDAPEY